MQKPHVFSLSLIGMLLLTVLSFWPSPSLVNAQIAPTPTTTTNNRTITVTGEGIYLVKPDIAYIYPNIQITDASLLNAALQVYKVTNDLTASMKALKIPDSDIQVINYTLDHYSGEPYIVEITLQITVRDLTKINDVVIKVFNSGNITLHGINFDVSDPQSARAQARKAALNDAKLRASDLASNMNGTLGQILSIQEGIPTGIYPIQYGGFPLSTSNLIPNSLQVTVDLTVTFEVR